MKRVLLALVALLGISASSCYCGPAYYRRPGYYGYYHHGYYGGYGGHYGGHYGHRRW